MKDYSLEGMKLVSTYQQKEASPEDIQFQTLVSNLYAAGFNYRHVGTLEIDGVAYFLTEELKKHKELNLSIPRKQVGDIIVIFPNGLQQATIYVEEVSVHSKRRREAICFKLDGSIHISRFVNPEMKPIIVQAFTHWMEWLDRLHGIKMA